MLVSAAATLDVHRFQLAAFAQAYHVVAYGCKQFAITVAEEFGYVFGFVHDGLRCAYALDAPF